MLEDLLEQLDNYNVEIREKELELKRRVLARVREFYEENKAEFEEIGKLSEALVKAAPPIGNHVELEMALKAEPGTFSVMRQETSEGREYTEKGAFLAEKLNQKLSDLSIHYPGPICTPLTISMILDVGIKNFEFERTLFINANSPLYVLEDRGYELLFRIAGEILKGFVPNLDYNATYWGGGQDYVSRFFQHGRWKHLGLEDRLENPYDVVHIRHDVNSERKPFRDGSEDVAIIKTLGGIGDKRAYARFWKKMTDSLRIRGIVVSSYELPEEFKRHYRHITNLGGSSRDFLEFSSVTNRIQRDAHYFPDRIYFFEKVR